MAQAKIILSPKTATALGILLVSAQIAVIAEIGPTWTGALLSNLIQLLLGILTLLATLQAASRCSRLGRYFWSLASVSYAIWVVAQALDIYTNSIHPGAPQWLINFLFSSYYIPIGLALILGEDSETERNDWLRAIDLCQAFLFWVAAFAYFLRGPEQEGTLSIPLAPYFICYGVISGAFFLRSLVTIAAPARALFQRAGIFLLMTAVADALYAFGPGHHLPTGSWFGLVWSLLLLIPLVAAVTWKEAATPELSEPRSISRKRKMEAQLFCFLYPVLTLCMAVPIVRAHMVLASAVVMTSLCVSVLRLFITQYRLMVTEESLREDILSRKRAEEAHRQIEERFAKAFRSNPVGIAITTRDEGLILEINDAIERLMELSRSELIGQSSKNLNFWAPGEREQILTKLQEQGSVRDYECKFQNRAGQMKECQVSIEQIRVQEESCLLVTVRDVTNNRLMERQLRTAQKLEAVGRLAGGVAHDFNNLLMIASANAELMERAKNDPDRIVRYARQITAVAERGAGLTRQLLAVSREQVLNPSILNLNTVLTDLWKLLPRLLGADITTNLALDPALGHVNTDRGQLEQVIMNLAVNARDAMPLGGTLTVRTANAEIEPSHVAADTVKVPSGRYVLLTVSDTGSGMSPAILDHIFDPFFTTKDPGKGTGLGLSTVYGVVKQIGGYVFANSEVGKGSTFEVYLPRIEDKASSKETNPQPESVPNGSETILLVEDELALRECASEYLRAKGYHVLEASCGEAALEICRTHKGQIHLLITDVVMPGVSGPSVAKAVSAIRPTVRTIFVSGYSDSKLAAELHESDAAFFQKPFNLDALAQKIHVLLHN